MGKVIVDTILKTQLDKSGINSLKSEIQALKKVTEDDLIKIGSAQNLDEAKNKISSIKNSILQVERALNQAFNVKLNDTDLVKLNSELRKLDLKTITKDFNLLGAAGQNAFNKVVAESLTVNNQLKQTNKIIDDLATSFKNTVTWGLSSSVWNTMTNSLSKAYSYAKNLNTSLTDIRIVSNESAENMARFAVQANKAAKTIGGTTLDYTNAALIYYQQGLSGEDVIERTNATLKLANTTGEAAKDVSDYMTAIWNNFDKGSHSIEYYADVLAKLGAETASSSDEIAAGLEKFASVADTIGLSYEYATSALTTITATTRQSADIVGTALKTLFSRIQDLELGNTLEDGTTIGTYSEALEKVGIDIKSANGDLKDMDDILDEMGAKWGTLQKDQQVALAQAVAGIRQYNQLMALMNNWSDMTLNIQRTAEAEGTLNQQNQIYLESTKAHLDQLRVSAERLYNDLIDSEGVNNLVDLFSNLVSGVSNYVEAIGGSKSAITQLGAVLLNTFGKNLSQDMIRFISNLKLIKTNSEQIAAQAQLTQLFKGIKIEDGSYKKLLGMVEGLNQYRTILTQTQIDEANAAILQQNQLDADVKIWDEKVQKAQEYYQIVSNGRTLDLKDPNINTEAISKELQKYIEKIGKLQKETSAFIKDPYNFGGGSGNGTLEEYFQRAFGEINSNSQIPASIKQKLAKLREQISSATYDLQEGDDLRFSDEQLEGIQSFGEIFQEVLKTAEKQSKETKKVVEDSANGMSHALSYAAEQSYKAWQEKIEEFRTQAIISDVADITSNVMMLSSAISSVGNIPSIWENEDLSTGEKVLQTIMAVANAANGLASTYKMVHSIADLLTIAQIANTAANRENTKSLDDNQTQMHQTNQLTEIESELLKNNNIRYNENTVQIEKNEKARKKNFTEQLDNVADIEKENSDWYNFGLEQEEKSKKKAQAKGLSGYQTNLFTQEAYKPTKVKSSKEIIEKAAQMQDLGKPLDDITDKAEETGEAISNIGTGKGSLGNKGGIFTNLKKDLGVIKTAIASIPPTAYIAVAAIAAIGIGLAIVIEKSKEEERRLEKLKESYSQLQKEISETGDKIGSLETILTQYNELVGVLENCTRGTDEWSNALYDVNSKIVDILAQYPKLAEFNDIYTDEGLLNTTKVKDYIKELKELETIQKIASVNMSQQISQQQLKIQEKDLVKQIKNTPSIWGYDVQHNYENSGETFYANGAVNMDIMEKWGQKLVDRAQDFSNLSTEAFKNKLSELGNLTDDEKNILAKFQKNVNELANSAEKNAIAISNAAWTIAQISLGEKASGTETTVYASQYQDEYQKIKDELLDKKANNNTSLVGGNISKASGSNNENYRNALDRLNKAGYNYTTANNGVRGTDNNRYLAFTDENGKEVVLSAEAVAERIAAYEAKNKVDNQKDNNYKDISNQLTSKISKGLGGDTNLADQILSDKGDLSNLSREQMEKIVEAFNNGSLTLTDNEAAEIGKTNAEEYLKGLQEKITEWSSKNDGDLVKEEINSIFETGAKAANTTVDALDTYAKALQKVNKNLSDKDAAKAAVTTFKFAKYTKELSKSLEDNKDILNKWAKSNKTAAELGTDTATAVSEVQSSLEDMYGMKFSEDFVKKNFDTIKKAIDGDVKSLNQLDIAAAKEYIVNLDYYDDVSSELANSIQNWTSVLANADLEVGLTFDNQQALKDLNSFFEAAKMTKDQAQKYLNSLGFEGDLDTKEVPVTHEWDTYTTSDDGKVTHTKTKQVEKIQVAVIKGKESGGGIKGLTAISNTKQQANSLKNQKGKSGSKKSKNTSNDKLDRYQEVNNQLAETNAELKKIQSQTDKLTGPDLVKNLNSQIQNLNKNLELTEKKLKIAKQEQQEYVDKLRDTYGIQFNTDGSINQESYAAKFAAEQKKYTSAYSDNEAAKTRWEDFKELISQYNTLDTTIQGLIQDKIDNANTIIEKQIAAFRVSFDISLDLTDARKQWLEFKKEVVDELADENLLGVLKDYGEQLKTYFRSDSTGAISQDEKRLSSLVEIYKKLQAGDTTTIYGDNKQKLLEDIEEAQKQLQDDLTEWENLIDEIQNMYLKGLEQASEAFSNAIADMESITQIIDHQIKLMEYAMGSKAYKEQNKAYTDKVKAIQSQIDLQTKENIFWKNQLEITEERLKNVKDTNSEEYYKVLEEYQKAKEEYENSTNDLLASFEEQMDALTSAYVANIEAVFDEFNKGLTGSLSLDDAQSQWELLNKQSEEYLDTINSIYGIQSIANKYTESINEQSISAQQKLSKIMESELEQLRSKDKLSQYDLDRADLRYQIALKQIALEEAQQNKTTLRLRRDSQGNYSYQYTQDEDEISKLQNELSDLYNQLYNLDTGKYNDNLQKVYDLTAEYQDKYKEILQDASLADEERQQKIFELTETYGNLINSLTEQNEDIKANLRESAMAELFDLYGKDENNYMSLTEAQKNILSQYLNDNLDLTNSAYNSIFGIYDENVEKTKQMTEEQLNELMTSLVPGWTSAYQNIVDNLNSEGGFKSAMKDINNELLEASNKYFDTIRASYSEADNIALEHRSIVEDIIGDYADLVESYDTLMKNIANSQAQLETFVSAWSQAAKDSAELLHNTQETIDAMKTLELVSSEKENENIGSTSNTATSNIGDAISAGTDANVNSISNEDKAEGVAAAIWLRGSNSSGWGQGRERSRKLSEKGVSKAQSYLNSASNGSLYKKWKGKDLSPYYYGAFDTGGYTGEWNSSEGRLAILHQKELVLNAEDTKNILASVAMLRNLTNANLSQLNTHSISGENTLEQNVHIEANFPNVSNSNEIEEAFNNLVNIAAQRVNR